MGKEETIVVAERLEVRVTEGVGVVGIEEAAEEEVFEDSVKVVVSSDGAGMTDSPNEGRSYCFSSKSRSYCKSRSKQE